MNALSSAKERRFHIMACPRSGTQYMTLLLKSTGLKVAHEGIGEDGSVNYFYHNQIYPKIILHQVRNPLRVIPSLTVLSDKWKVQFSFFAGLKSGDMDTIEGAALVWLAWIDRIEKCEPDFVYKIEEVNENWPQICRLIGIKPVSFPSHVKKIGHKNHNWQSKGIDWPDLGCARNEVMKKSIQYGYDVNIALENVG